MLDEVTTPGVIRKLMPWETALLRDHFLRLDPQARHCRFAAGVSDHTIATYAETALGADALVHGFFVGGVLRGAAELRLLPEAGSAEVAVTVEEDCRLTGIGTQLFRRLLLAARNRGVSNLVMTCLPSNRAMQRLAARFEGRVTYVSGDAFADVTAPPPSPMSLWREAWTDGSSMAAALVDAQVSLLRRQARFGWRLLEAVRP